jgi:transcriptional regulator GlxA family with amidase domain
VNLAFVVYPGFTALDLIGPCEVIGRWPDSQLDFVATTARPVRSDLGLIVTPTATTDALADPDVIVVPGASEPLVVLDDQDLLRWLARTAPQAKWTASVCTGAGLFAAAGLLARRRTATHWAFREHLRALGAEVVAERVVWDGTHISAAGVSAGIDMALALTARVHGEQVARALQLAIEYDPQPPFATGSPERADASTLRLALRMMLGDRPVRALASALTHLASARGRRPLGGRDKRSPQ